MGSTLVVAWFLFLSLSHAPENNSARLFSALPIIPAASSSSAAQEKIDPAKEADIRRMLEVGGAKGLMTQMMDQMGSSLKPMMVSALPPGEYRARLVDLFFAKFQAKVNLDEFLKLAVPIYDKYFTDEELKGLIKFYETPLGQKAVATLPNLMNDLSNTGRQWGEVLGRKCMEEVLAEHPDLAQALEAAGKQQQ